MAWTLPEYGETIIGEKKIVGMYIALKLIEYQRLVECWAG